MSPEQAALRVAIIGAGWMGGEHTRAAVTAGDRVVAVVDGRRESAEQLIQAEGLADAWTYDSIEEMLAPDEQGAITAAVIATPSGLHLEQLTALIGAGIPVLVEKPPWIIGQDAAPVIAAARANDTFVGVAMTTRFDPGVAAVQAAAAAGELGDVYSINDEIHFRLAPGDLSPWYFASPRAGGGIVHTNGVHALDRAEWILGAPMRLTSSLLASSDPSMVAEDVAVLHLHRADDGPPAAITVQLLWSSYEPPPSRLQVVGSLGVATTDSTGKWDITTSTGVRSGHRPAAHNGRELQWLAFRERVLGGGPHAHVLPTLGDLQPAMDLVCEAVADRQGCTVHHE